MVGGKVEMTENPLKYFEISMKLNERFSAKLKEKQLHFRGNRNSYSLISLSQDTPELGLSGLKTINQGENALERYLGHIGLKPGRKTPEKELQAWIIKYAINNSKELPFGQELTFLSSELAFTDVQIVSQKKKGKLVNDLLAIDENETLWVIELKSNRQQTRLKDQVRDFIHLIHTKRAFFYQLVQLLTDSKHDGYKQVKGMIVWPDNGYPRDDWGDIEEIRYSHGFSFKDRHT